MNLGELNVLLVYADNIVIMRNSRDDIGNTNHSKIAEVEQEDED